MRIVIATQEEMESYNKYKDSYSEMCICEKESLETLIDIFKDPRIPILFKSGIVDSNSISKLKANLDFKKYGFLTRSVNDLEQDVIYTFSVSTSRKDFINYFIKAFGPAIEECISTTRVNARMDFYEINMKFDGSLDQEKADKFIDCLYDIIANELSKMYDTVEVGS